MKKKQKKPLFNIIVLTLITPLATAMTLLLIIIVPLFVVTLPDSLEGVPWLVIYLTILALSILLIKITGHPVQKTMGKWLQEFIEWLPFP